MTLTIREDDVGRWWSFRCIIIGLPSFEEELAIYRAKRARVQHLHAGRKEGCIPWGDAGIFFCPLRR